MARSSRALAIVGADATVRDGHVARAGITGPALGGVDDMTVPPLPGGEALRGLPTGLTTGRTRHRIDGPHDALALVADDLRRAEAVLRELVAHDVEALPHVARYLVDAGGKRLRPAITALAARALDLPASPELMGAGELIHLGSLLHDDVVDQGDVRRGRLASHVVYGNAVAVLAGDLCVAKALLAASEAGGHRASRALAATVAEMAAGEVLQLQLAGRMHDDLGAYLRIIDRKSASLLAWCASAPALATGDPHAADALARYGRNVGLAYQITDDALDYREETGKRRGADLRERKLTLPLIRAMERLPHLRDRLLAGPPDEVEVERLADEVARSGALEEALGEADQYVRAALEALRALPEGVGRDALAALARHLVERTR